MIKNTRVIGSCTVLRTMPVIDTLTDAAPAAGASRGGGMTCLLLVAAALVVTLACGGAAAGAEWHVYPGAGTPIQDAIDGAGEGDTIYVHEGTYDENVDVGKRLTLIGDGADVVTVTAEDAEDHVFDVTVDQVNISGFTVTGATGGHDVGIYLINADHCNIYDNNISNNEYGIHLHSSSNNNIIDNNVLNNSWYGIDLRYSSNNSIIDNNASGNDWGGIRLSSSSYNNITDNNASDNQFYGIDLSASSNNNLDRNNASNNWYGISLSSSGNNNLTDNIMSGNKYNFGVRGSQLSFFIQNIDTSNLVNGKPVYYWVGRPYGQIPSNAGFIGIVNSINITIRDLTVTNNIDGVLFAYTNNSIIENVTISSNQNGITMGYSSNNMLVSSIITNNDWGIYTYSSSNNLIYHNNFLDNAYYNAYDQSINQWNSSTEGNYYSDYTGTDSDGDGIGDTPHPIPGRPGGLNMDHHPLIEPWHKAQRLGDLNHDDRITPADAAIALRIAATGAHDDAADVSGDGCVTSLDALMILQAAAGAITI